MLTQRFLLLDLYDLLLVDSFPVTLSHCQNADEVIKKLEAFRRNYSGKLQ